MTVLDNLIVAQGLHEKTSVIDAVIHTPKMRREYREMSEKALKMLAVIWLENKAFTILLEYFHWSEAYASISDGRNQFPEIIIVG